MVGFVPPFLRVENPQILPKVVRHHLLRRDSGKMGGFKTEKNIKNFFKNTPLSRFDT